MSDEYDVIVIGGGATGAGVARDAALRGLNTLLLERNDIADGASGRNHGLLHSGARYAVSDPEGARECISENTILRHIAAGCVQNTGGLFISLPDDSLAYQQTFIQSCQAASIPVQQIDPAQALQMEPALHPDIIGAVMVPDAAVDPFRLVMANVLDAKRHGAQIRLRSEVVNILVEGTEVRGVEVRNLLTGQLDTFYGRFVVNAAGIWGAKLVEKVGIHIGMLPAKGSLLVFGHLLSHRVINRCRKPANADILVPDDVVSIIGTTSDNVPFSECDTMRVTTQEVDELLREGAKMVPALTTTRILRAYAGVRPLVTDDADSSGRSVSRGMVLLDHQQRDGLQGLITITGGKLTTYRLMAQRVTDLIVSRMGLDRTCQTHLLPLPGSQSSLHQNTSLSVPDMAASIRLGEIASQWPQNTEPLCECEHVSRQEIAFAVHELGVRTLNDLRRRTRVGMGTCQGAYCMRRVAQALAEELGSPQQAEQLLRDFLQERWHGMVPVMWGEGLREAEYMRFQLLSRL